MKRSVSVALALAALCSPPSEALADSGLAALAKPRAEGDTPHFLPTLSAAIGTDGTEKKDVYGSFILGASHYPLSQPWSPFYSIAAELDLRTVERAEGPKTVAVFGPQVRAGISFFPDNNGIISVFNAYAFVGYRAPSPVDDGAIRCGMGVSSPGIGLALLANRLPLPWMLEWALDAAPGDLRFGGRLGISY